MNFKKEVALGIPNELPNKKNYDSNVNHAPIRENLLTPEEKILALSNALRYFDKKFHEELIPEFKSELEKNLSSELLNKLINSFSKFL